MLDDGGERALVGGGEGERVVIVHKIVCEVAAHRVLGVPQRPLLLAVAEGAEELLVEHIEDGGRKEIDIKRYAKVEKIPGGDMEDCRVLKGVMINKDVVHAKMRRRIEKPRILLLDCTLEYKKGESQTQIELSDEKAWEALLQEEENAIKVTTNT